MSSGPTIDPKALLNPKAGSVPRPQPDPPPIDNPISSSTTEDPEAIEGQMGQGSILERMHGVTNREAPPSKKRKANPEDQNDQNGNPRNAFSGGGNGGILGEYMKSERDKGASDAGPIDLTNDDDDEVVILSEKKGEETKEVCLGKLVANANAFRVPSVPKNQAGKTTNEYWPQTRVAIRRSKASNHIIELFDRVAGSNNTGQKFGVLEVKVASALCPLLDGSDVNKMRVRAYVQAHKRGPGEHPGARVSKMVPIALVLYAPKRLADGIGRMLSQKQIFLSEPGGVPVDSNTEIFNPHAPRQLGSMRKDLRKPQSSQQPTYGVSRTAEEMLREASSMFDSLVKNEDIPEAEADASIVVTPLMSHQKKALRFLIDHERADDNDDDESKFSLWKPRVNAKNRQVYYNVITNHEVVAKPEPVRGGILADMMGLGKTLSILALITSSLKDADEFGSKDHPQDIERVRRNTKGTLIVCPKSVMSNWSEQIATHIKLNRFKVYGYYGTNRTQDIDELASYDIVLVSYQTAAIEFSDSTGKRGALASLNWFRIVLDEAHQIRTQNTNGSKACCALSAQRRWAVTGTPVQNKLDDLGALIKFLRIKPFDQGQNWAQHILAPFKNADQNVLKHLRLLVDGITLRRMKDGIGLKGRLESNVRLDFSPDEHLIYSQFSKQSNLQLRMMTKDGTRLKGKSYAHVLKALGRLRAISAHGREMLHEDDLKELEGLTESTAIDLGDEPDEESPDSFIKEKQAYEALHMMSESEVDMCALCSKKIGDKKADPETVATDSDDTGNSDESTDLEDEDDTMGYLTPCYHLLCPPCKDNYISQAQPEARVDGYHRCAVCEQYVRLGVFELHRAGLRSMLEARENATKRSGRDRWDESTYSGPHTKVKALLDDLKQSTEESAANPYEDPIRSVVFSGWTTYLDLIEYALDQHGIGFVRLDGKMSVKARSAALDTFRTDPAVTVLIVSIKAGGQGLNFTAASKVYMMEPQFNPGVEQQAIDRVHRLGQKRDVDIKHYIMRDSVEEKILLLQQKKNQLAALSLEKKMGREEEAKQRMEELKDLFK